MKRNMRLTDNVRLTAKCALTTRVYGRLYRLRNRGVTLGMDCDVTQTPDRRLLSNASQTPGRNLFGNKSFKPAYHWIDHLRCVRPD